MDDSTALEAALNAMRADGVRLAADYFEAKGPYAMWSIRDFADELRRVADRMERGEQD